MDINELFNQFTLFDPAQGQRADLPAVEGNYIVMLKTGCNIPDVLGNFKYTEVSLYGVDYRVLYTGVASNLKSRIWTNHLHGNGGNSTLRKTLGSLFGYQKIARDKNYQINKKTKFCAEDENSLTAWMERNLLFAYLANDKRNELESFLIDSLLPPLNVEGSKAATLKRVHELRCDK